jgi:hypothetical protein
LKVLEKRVATGTPCAHPLPALTNPTEVEIDAMLETLAACPNCRTPKFNTPTMLIARFDRRVVDPLDSKGGYDA